MRLFAPIHALCRAAASTVGLAVVLALPAAGTAAATPTPGMGAGASCSPVVSYTTDGTHRTTRPLPAPSSQVGGAALARSGLQVTPAATAAPPGPDASAWLVADLDSGQVLAACNAHVPLAPASCLKVLTALTLMPRIDPSTLYVARDEDARVDGTRVGLVPGSVYPIDDLWHALLMGSANDAAVALGSLAGGPATATDLMRQTAVALGAADTVPQNTSGLDLPGQVSSAYDLALFGRAALADRRIATVLQTRDYAFPEAGSVLPGARAANGAVTRRTFQIQNHDRLLYNYAGALGVKDGWTSTTGGSFIGAAQRGGRRIIVTVLAADPQTWHMSAALLDWAFAHTPATAQGVGRLVTGPDPAGALSPTGVPVTPAATTASSVTAAPARGSGPSVGGVAAAVVVLGSLAAGAVVLTRSRRSRSRGE